MISLTLHIVAIVLGIFLTNAQALAHGGVTIENDTCVMRLGSYRVHFVGYQPERTAAQEFCEDIPDIGHAIIVLDYVDRPLREMETGVRILEHESWDAAQIAENDQAAKPVVEMQPKVYKKGSILVDHRFNEPGYFVGLVTAQRGSARPLVSRFPFRVGMGLPKSNSGYVPWVVVALVLFGLAFVYYRSRRSKGQQPAV